ncbi:MAG: hypothetical protein ACRCWC_15475 [Plesiomonas shigelloides]
MQRNYDTTNGQPFVYFDVYSVKKDPATGIVSVVYTDRMALKDADGKTRFLDGPLLQRTFEIRPEDMGTAVPYVDLATGAHLPATQTLGQIMAGNIAAVRYHQKLLDAAESQDEQQA